ncbi:MAG: hypothetical protein VW274_00950, partial [Thalassolituus sp.]
QVVTNGAGVNSSNYNNPRYNELFEKMKLMENTPERMAIIREMLDILHTDTPWASSFHPHSYVLNNPWVYNSKPHGISKAVLKYLRIDPELRAEMQREINRPVVWPLIIVALILLVMALPGYLAYRRRLNHRIQVENATVDESKEGGR